jgi:hypothetical protein
MRSIKYLRFQSVLQHLETSGTSHTSETFELCPYAFPNTIASTAILTYNPYSI